MSHRRGARRTDVHVTHGPRRHPGTDLPDPPLGVPFLCSLAGFDRLVRQPTCRVHVDRAEQFATPRDVGFTDRRQLRGVREDTPWHVDTHTMAGEFRAPVLRPSAGHWCHRGPDDTRSVWLATTTSPRSHRVPNSSTDRDPNSKRVKKRGKNEYSGDPSVRASAPSPIGSGLNDGSDLIPPEEFPFGTTVSSIRSAAARSRAARGSVRGRDPGRLLRQGDAASQQHFEDLFFSTGVLPHGSVKEYFTR